MTLPTLLLATCFYLDSSAPLATFHACPYPYSSGSVCPTCPTLPVFPSLFHRTECWNAACAKNGKRPPLPPACDGEKRGFPKQARLLIHITMWRIRGRVFQPCRLGRFRVPIWVWCDDGSGGGPTLLWKEFFRGRDGEGKHFAGSRDQDPFIHQMKNCDDASKASVDLKNKDPSDHPFAKPGLKDRFPLILVFLFRYWKSVSLTRRSKTKANINRAKNSRVTLPVK
jgi:hypothetical protein